MENNPTWWQILLKNILGQESSWFWTMVQAIIVGITLLFIYSQVRIQRYTNMLTTLNSLIERWNSEIITKARIITCQQYLANQKKVEDINIVRVLNFFEELGLYYKKKVFDTDVLWSMFALQVENYWSVLSPMIHEYRAEEKDKTYYEDFEYMKNEFEKYSRKRGLNIVDKTGDQIREYAEKQIIRLEKSLTEQGKTLPPDENS